MAAGPGGAGVTGAAAAVLVAGFAAIAVAAVYSWARLRVRVAGDETAALGELAARRADELARAMAAGADLEAHYLVERDKWQRRYRALAEKHGDTDALATDAVDRLRGGLFGPDATRDDR